MWEVELAGDSFDLDELVLSMSKTEPSICKTLHGYILRSEYFNQMNTHAEVEESATEILSVLNGICVVLLSTRKSISISAIAKVFPGQPRQTYISVQDGFHAKGTFSMVVTNSDGTVVTTYQADPAVAWLKLASDNLQVAKVFRLLNDPHLNWGPMYKIFEIILDDMQGFKPISDLGWASQSAMKRFKHTANSPTAAGDLARHGVEPTSPPAAPMAMSEAKSLIDTLVHNWLRTKA